MRTTDHELQDLSANEGHEEREELLSSFTDNDSPYVRNGSGTEPDTNHSSNDSRIVEGSAADATGRPNVALFETSVGTSGSRSEPVPPTTTVRPQRRRRQVPNTIVHKLINSPRFSKYVPHLVRNYYQPLYNGSPMGQGLNNDGVFTNMAAKPSTTDEVTESLPTYEQASMDTTPPYWESSVISPGFEDEIFVEGLPVGSLAIFLWNFIVSFSFQFVGFFLTYLLHTSHGSKEGSRAGLGLTFMNYGYNLLPVNYYNRGDSPIDKFEPNNPNSIDVDNSQNLEGQVLKNTGSNFIAEDAAKVEESSETPIFAFGLIALGLFIVLKSVIDYHRARQTEKMILNPNYGTTSTSAPTTTPTETTETSVPEEV